MEWLLLNFCEIFTHTTGILAAWGMMACYILFKTTLQAYHNRKLIRKSDVLYLIGLVISTSLLMSLLFVFTDFTTKHMIAIFFFEVWYAGFALYFTTHYLEPCLTEFERRKQHPNIVDTGK